MTSRAKKKTQNLEFSSSCVLQNKVRQLVLRIANSFISARNATKLHTTLFLLLERNSASKQKNKTFDGVTIVSGLRHEPHSTNFSMNKSSTSASWFAENFPLTINVFDSSILAKQSWVRTKSKHTKLNHEVTHLMVTAPSSKPKSLLRKKKIKKKKKKKKKKKSFTPSHYDDDHGKEPIFVHSLEDISSFTMKILCDIGQIGNLGLDSISRPFHLWGTSKMRNKRKRHTHFTPQTNKKKKKKKKLRKHDRAQKKMVISK